MFPLLDSPSCRKIKNVPAQLSVMLLQLPWRNFIGLRALVLTDVMSPLESNL